MKIEIIGWLSVFWAMQVLAHCLFKYGSTLSARHWLGFVAGNAVGVLSILVLMKLYQFMQVNVAGALALGGGFLVAQLSIALVFSQNLSVWQYMGLAMVASGMMLVSATGREEEAAGVPKKGEGSAPVEAPETVIEPAEMQQ